MRRYNLFRIHKGLRALLYDTALQLQKTAFADFEQSDAALENVYVAIEFIEVHINLEEAYIFSLLAKYEKATVSAFNSQQQESLRLAEEIKKISRIFQYTETDSERRIAGSALTNAYMQFMMSQLNLMSHEEMEINHMLWYHFNDARLVSMEQQVLASLSPAEMIVYSKWMVKGLADNEMTEWLSGLKKAVRSLVFNAVMNHIHAQLPPESWYRISEELGAGALAA
jgi:hypothetical protein